MRTPGRRSGRLTRRCVRVRSALDRSVAVCGGTDVLSLHFATRLAQDESTALARGQQLPDDVAALAQELGIAPPSERPWTSYNTIQPSLRAMRGVKQQHGAGGPPPDDGAAGGDGEAAGALGRVAQRAARAWARLGRLAQASEEVRRAPPSALQQLLAGAHALQDVIASLWCVCLRATTSGLVQAPPLGPAAQALSHGVRAPRPGVQGAAQPGVAERVVCCRGVGVCRVVLGALGPRRHAAAGAHGRQGAAAR